LDGQQELKMFEGHIQNQLTAYLDGEMTIDVRARAGAHLERCGHCRDEMDRVRGVALVLKQLPLVTAPEGLWQAIDAAADSRRSRTMPVWRYAAAAAAVVVVTASAAMFWQYSQAPVWQVTTLAGSTATTQTVRTGRWIETGNTSRARIKVADIGSVEVEPHTRVRLVDTGSAGHRLALESGALTAKILAPPRLFFVDTPAGTAIDLGCEYRLQCDRAGAGLLRVSGGWVALEWHGKEVLVPTGASCRMRPGQGPGTPWFDDAAAGFVRALDTFDTARSELGTILAAARSRDTLTLWHLLPKVTPGERPLVYDRMAALAPPPTGVTRDRVLSLDADALTQWKNELAWIW
jgi:anti-sigma factor RsiW